MQIKQFVAKFNRNSSISLCNQTKTQETYSQLKLIIRVYCIRKLKTLSFILTKTTTKMNQKKQMIMNRKTTSTLLIIMEISISLLITISKATVSTATNNQTLSILYTCNFCFSSNNNFNNLKRRLTRLSLVRFLINFHTLLQALTQITLQH